MRKYLSSPDRRGEYLEEADLEGELEEIFKPPPES